MNNETAKEERKEKENKTKDEVEVRVEAGCSSTSKPVSE